MNELVSIIIPVYNSEKYLKECLYSIKMQTYPNIEILVVDDGSSDKSKYIVESFFHDNRFKYIYQQNLGVSAARNTGLRACNGQYVMFIDADDFIEKNYVEKYLIAINKENCDIVVGGYHSEKNNILNYQSTSSDTKTFIDNCVYGTGGVVWAKIYRREVLKNIFFDETISMREDMYFNFNICGNIENVGYINDYGYNYRISNNSLSSKKNIDINSIAVKKILNFLNTLKCDKALSHFFKNIIFWDCVYLLKNKEDLDILLKNDVFNKYKDSIILSDIKDIILFGIIKQKNKFLIKLVYKNFIRKEK